MLKKCNGLRRVARSARAFHSALEFSELTGSELTIMIVIERLPAYG